MKRDRETLERVGLGETEREREKFRIRVSVERERVFRRRESVCVRERGR